VLTPEQLNALRQDIVFTAELGGRDPDAAQHLGSLLAARDRRGHPALLLAHLQVRARRRLSGSRLRLRRDRLAMATLAPQGQTLMVDKDFVAVDYAARNIKVNRLENARAQLSNGFDQIDPELRFDLIASNVPAKVGKELLALLLHDAHARLRPGGRLYLVTINGLRQYMKRNLTEVFGNYDKLKQGAHYTVALAERST
jgi:16S rRNA (guanine1207-N2)-methyltransferase